MREDRVAQVLQAAAADDLLPEGATVLVAVSGGVDSSVLLDLLIRVGRQRELALHVAHVDHRLRPGSAAEASFVAGLADAAGLPHHPGVLDPAPDGASGPGSPEERARDARLAFLEETAAAVGATRIALGHHADDRAEWVLLRMLQGVPPEGWLLPRRRGPWVRPLFDLRRGEIEAYARARGLVWREDPSNRDTRVPRNLVRHALLPRLAGALNPGLVGSLVALAEEALEDASCLEPEVRRLARDSAGPAGSLRCGPLAAAPRALARRVVGRWLEEQGAIEPARRLVTSLLALSTRAPGRRASVDLPGGARAVASEGLLRIEGPGKSSAGSEPSP